MENPKNAWQFDRTVNLGNVLTMIVIAVSGAGVVLSLEKRVTVLEERQSVQSHVDRTQEERIRELGLELKNNLHSINDKLDKLVERQLDYQGAR